MKVITTENKPIKLWLEDIEDGAMEQAKNLANLPFIFNHLAIMPDSHQGYGMPIGGVLATKGVIIPNAVGVDIGCGMCAVKTSLININKPDLEVFVSLIKRSIPVGFNHQSKPQDSSLMPKREPLYEFPIISREYENSLSQLGTLGGGNHFIEIQKGTDGYIWIMIHCGSRNLGKQVADYYNKIAVRNNELWFSQVEKSKELAFLPIETKEAKQYLSEMNFCVEFAFANRKLIINNIQKDLVKIIPFVEFEPIINIAHNYARFEHHFGSDVIIHRKGATSATIGEVGIIPGSMGTKSYIVEGLGDPESFMSCS